jgi:DNA-directed RNA polymerase subunit M/transcription elongation factor TFIIS
MGEAKDKMVCPKCGRVSITVERRRTRNAYVDDERNFLVSCAKCYDEDDAYWKEQWEDFYSNCM